MNNLDIYNKLKSVPDNAKKAITGGRLKGMTDINPMWRIKALTEQFGPCGVGWYYRIKDKRLEPAGTGEVAAFVDIELNVRINGEWSVEIPGTGGSMFVANEKNGAYVSDECFKMALTDALSVACKALGVGADVYWNEGGTKYASATSQNVTASKPQTTAAANNGVPKCTKCGKDITAAELNFSTSKYGKALCRNCQREV